MLLQRPSNVAEVATGEMSLPVVSDSKEPSEKESEVIIGDSLPADVKSCPQLIWTLNEIL